MLANDDLEICADPLDQASQLTQRLNDASVTEARHLSAPEQVQNQDGTWPVTECVDCGSDLGERASLARVRCIHCQERVEKKRNGYGPA